MSKAISSRTKELRAIIRSHKRWDAVFGVLGLLAMMVGVLTLAALFTNMAIDGIPRLTGDFFTSFPSRRAGQAGILSAWVGSILVMLVTALFAVPVGIAGAVYLEEYAKKNWFTDVIEINISNLAGVPSIVYGLLALGLFVYALGFGQSILTAGLTLGLLILPIVIVATRESLRAIPQHVREGAYACGATQWQVVRDHLLPYGTPGILTGVIIALSRAIGETAPLVVIGASTAISFDPTSPFSKFTTLPIQIYQWTARPQEEFRALAAAAILVLLALLLTLNATAIQLRNRFSRKY